ncbi:GNAT family N-acetyltransferase [Spirosoma soli]|uniref:GNAT family N-acetyltransferase n=1 Tax=Spirosoma soli TaxID=1770529 RepID=A0ABW5LZB8_9BACT
MNIRYEFHNGLPSEPLITSMVDLLQTVFNNRGREETVAELSYQLARTAIPTFLAIDDQTVVGCKLGYERQPGQFYSWLGCVSPSHRGQGIAAELMRQQHDWCRQQGYMTIRTQTYNQWRNMLILNLRFGFNIVGALQGKHGLMIVLEKDLQA